MNTFHEKSALCRAAENRCWFVTVNYASAGAPTTSAVVRPDGTLLGHQPYGVEGIYLADVDLAAATGLLARRFRGVGAAAEGLAGLRLRHPGASEEDLRLRLFVRLHGRVLAQRVLASVPEDAV